MTFRATTVLPYDNLDRATAGLRAERRRQLMFADVHAMPVWDSFEVTGADPVTDARERMWFEYRASVESRGPFDRTRRPEAPQK